MCAEEENRTSDKGMRVKALTIICIRAPRGIEVRTSDRVMRVKELAKVCWCTRRI